MCPQFWHSIFPSCTFVYVSAEFSRNTSRSVECSSRNSSSSCSGDKFSGFSWGKLLLPSFYQLWIWIWDSPRYKSVLKQASPLVVKRWSGTGDCNPFQSSTAPPDQIWAEMHLAMLYMSLPHNAESYVWVTSSQKTALQNFCDFGLSICPILRDETSPLLSLSHLIKVYSGFPLMLLILVSRARTLFRNFDLRGQTTSIRHLIWRDKVVSPAPSIGTSRNSSPGHQLGVLSI